MSADLPDFVLTPQMTAFLVCEIAVLLTGVVLLARRRHDLRSRIAGTSLNRLAPAPYPVSDILLTAAFAFGGALIAQIATAHYARQWFPPAEDGTPGLFEVVVGAAFQLGLLAGLAHGWFWHLRSHDADACTSAPATLAAYSETAPPPPPQPQPPAPKLTAAQAVVAGARTFAILLPIVWISSLAWQLALKALDIPAPPQDLVVIFMRTGDKHALAAMIFFAVLVAPLTEEILFRAGIFRWLRTRVTRGVALLLPSVLFSLLHFSWAALFPLAVLAVGLSIAYERSGNPLTPITAHALFNLNTLVLLLVGFPA